MRILLLATVICVSLKSAHAAEDTPLAGLIWGVEQNAFVSFPEMLEDIKSHTYILVGERHGRHAHQNREAFLIGALAEQGRYPSIAFEMLTHEQTDTVANFRKSNPEYALALGVELNWSESNWPSWNFYSPVFDAAFTTKATIFGADLSNAEQQATDKLDKSALPPSSFEYYSQKMTEAHCGLIDNARVDNLAKLQIARDQNMAQSLKDNKDPDHGVLLIVGSSHISKSTGVPSYLEQEAVAVIALRETTAISDEFPQKSQDILSNNLNEYDYIWFTPSTEEVSFCDKIGKASNK